MKTHSLLIAASAMAMLAIPAQAAVRYDFTLLSTEPSTFGESTTASFSYTSPDFISVFTNLPAASLTGCSAMGTISGPLVCDSTLFFNSFFGNATVGITLSGRAVGPAVTTFFATFDPGIFLTAGTYETPAASIQAGRLVVTNLGPGAVPEPATWAMMLMGFGLVGASMRRRVMKVSYA